MADDKSIRGPADARRINIHEDYEIRYWTAGSGARRPSSSPAWSVSASWRPTSNAASGSSVVDSVLTPVLVRYARHASSQEPTRYTCATSMARTTRLALSLIRTPSPSST